MESGSLPCFVCNARFNDSKSLVCHLRLLHSSLNISKFTCKYESCFRVFDRLKVFEKHLSSHCRSSTVSHGLCMPKKSKVCYEVEREAVNLCSENGIPDEGVIPSGPDEGTGMETDDLSKPVLFFKAVANAVTRFLAKMYLKDAITRNHIQEIIDEMKELFCGSFLFFLEDIVMQALKASQCSEVGDIRCLFDIMRGMFDDVDTEWKRHKFFTEQNAYIEPVKYPVGTANIEKTVKGQIVVEPSTLTGTFISPAKILKSFLQLPGVLDQIIFYMDSLDKDADVMENVIQGTLWKNDIKPKFGDKLVLPLNLSFDDFETNKELGSHATVHKLSACHITIACLPPVFQSVLENMFLTLLFHASDKAFGLDEVFRPLIFELKHLEKEGLEVVVGDKVHRIYFALCLLLGDNLGLNTILGLVESFSANYFCRICKTHKDVTKSDIYERENLLRTEENYLYDLRKNDPLSTGIKVKCIWNDLTSFSNTVNIYADIMHDVIEGVGEYDMCFVIEHLVTKKKLLTYVELNNLVQGFFYGDQEFGNKPPLICQNRVKTETLGFSATELLCLIRYSKRDFL